MLKSAIDIVIVIFLLIFLGFLCERKKWLGDNVQTVLSRMTLRIAMPGLVLSNILTKYNREMLIESAPSLLIPALVMASCYLIAGLISRLLRLEGGQRGAFRGLFTFGNSAFLGMPVCLAIFGDTALPVILLYYLVNTLFWWLIGAPNLARDVGKRSGSALSRLASPPLVTTLLSLLLLFIGVKPPAVVLKTAEYLGALVTPLSMLFIGYMLSSLVRRGIRWQKGYGAVLVGRFLLGPLLCLPLCLLLGVPAQTLGIFYIQSGMPSQTQTSLWAKEVGGDAEYAAGAIALATLLGLAAIPIHVWLLGFII